MHILPKPLKMEELSSQTFTLPLRCITINNSVFPETCLTAFKERANYEIILQDIGDEQITILCDSRYACEEYSIKVDDKGVDVRASSERGVIWALATLYQMMDFKGCIPYCRIQDAPKYRHRGLSLDCARQFFPVSEIIKIIEQMSLVKMNTLHWHLTDDQGWRIESKQFPELHKQHGCEYYSQNDIVHIVSFAATRGIEVVPEVDIPGHVSSLLAVYPQYSCSGVSVRYARQGGIYPVILCAGNEGTYEFLNRLWDDICPLFPSSRFHIGGDEAPKKEWKDCPCCQKRIKDNRLGNETELQRYFTNRVVTMLEKRGKQAVCWSDALVAGIPEIINSVQYWSIEHDGFINSYIEEGGRIIYSDMFTLYFDYPHSMIPLRRAYESKLRITEIMCAKIESISGIEACIWSEHIKTPHRLEQLLFPRLYAVSEAAWSHDQDYEDFLVRLQTFINNFHCGDLYYTPECRWDPTGMARQSDTLAYLDMMRSAMTPEIHAETIENANLSKSFYEKFINSFFVPEEDAHIISQMLNGSI